MGFELHEDVCGAVAGVAVTRLLAWALVAAGGGLLVAAAAVAWGLAAALAVAGVELVVTGLVFVDVTPRRLTAAEGGSRGVTAPFGSRAA